MLLPRRNYRSRMNQYLNLSLNSVGRSRRVGPGEVNRVPDLIPSVTPVGNVSVSCKHSLVSEIYDWYIIMTVHSVHNQYTVQIILTCCSRSSFIFSFKLRLKMYFFSFLHPRNYHRCYCLRTLCCFRHGRHTESSLCDSARWVKVNKCFSYTFHPTFEIQEITLSYLTCTLVYRSFGLGNFTVSRNLGSLRKSTLSVGIFDIVLSVHVLYVWLPV